jgi:hypothetical protein
MVDVRDEDDVVLFSPAEPVGPLKKKNQQHVDIIDLSSPKAAEGEACWEPCLVPRTSRQQCR